MTTLGNVLADLEATVAAGQPLSTAEAARVFDCPDLISVGLLAEAARKAGHGDRITYGRVAEVTDAGPPDDFGDAGEVRIVSAPASIEAARALVRQTAARRDGAPLVGFSLADLVDLVSGDHMALHELAGALKSDGLESVASVPLDRLGDLEGATEIVGALTEAGLGAWRATVDRCGRAQRLVLIERAAAIQRATGAFRAFAPLARLDPRDEPSTGYDDVKTVAVARLVCRNIPSIQVDWQLYGPKLAQVAIAYGVDDLDGVKTVDTLGLGHRRSPREDIERQIRAAFATPAERNGRFEIAS